MPSPQHLLHFEGGNALSPFRAQALLARLQAAAPRITAVHARHVHWVWSESALDAGQLDKLAGLLRYGDPYAGPAPGARDVVTLVVAPRLGTVSPWASKATDIAHNCGLAIRRVERVTEYQLSLKTGLLGGVKALSPEELQAAAASAARPHDRERAAATPRPLPPCSTSSPPSPWPRSMCWAAAGPRWWPPTPNSAWH